MRAAILMVVAAALPGLLLDAPAAHADETEPHRLGDHPAIVVQRLYKAAGYDYASKFYPHPAWLYLSAAPPRDETAQVVAAASAPRAAVPPR